MGPGEDEVNTPALDYGLHKNGEVACSSSGANSAPLV